MTVFILSFVVIAILLIGMSIGVLLGRSPLKGSCGGMQNLGLKENCDICGGDANKCEKEQQNQLERKLEGKSEDLAYDASGSKKS